MMPMGKEKKMMEGDTKGKEGHDGSLKMDPKTMEKVCSGQDMKPEEMMGKMKKGKM